MTAGTLFEWCLAIAISVFLLAWAGRYAIRKLRGDYDE